MNNTWVKLYRKINENDLIGDTNALQVFIWLLTNVDRKNGSVRIGRFWLSKILNMNPSTLYKAIKRLEKKYKMVTAQSNSEYTTICLLNWAKYQATSEVVTQSGNSEVTAREQLGNTLQEVENRELRIRDGASLDYLLSIPTNDLAEFTLAFSCTDRQVISKGQGLYDYCVGHGRKYKDYKAMLRNALRKDFGERPVIASVVSDLPEMSDEQVNANFARLAQMKKEIFKN